MASLRVDLYAGLASGATNSTPFFFADAQSANLFLRGSPSTTTIQLSNADGVTSVIAENEWSVLTTMSYAAGAGPDMIAIDRGAKWLRTIRSETTEVLLHIPEGY